MSKIPIIIISFFLSIYKNKDGLTDLICNKTMPKNSLLLEVLEFSLIVSSTVLLCYKQKPIGRFGDGWIDRLVRLADRGSVQCWAHHLWSDSIHTAASSQWKPPSRAGHASCLWKSPVDENGQILTNINLGKVLSLISLAGKLQRDLHALGLDINVAQTVLSSADQSKFLPSLV